MVADRDAVDPFQRQHAARGAAPVDAGYAEGAEVGCGVARDVVGHLGDGGGLEAHVHLDLDGVRERVHHRHGLEAPRGRVEALELARGSAPRLLGDLVSLLGTLKGLPSGYNKDLQDDKRALFDAVDTALIVLPAVAGTVDELTFDAGRMRTAVTAATTEMATMVP